MYSVFNSDVTSEFSHYHGDCLKCEHHQSPVLISDHSSCGDLFDMSIQTAVFREFTSDMSNKERESMSSVRTLTKTPTELVLNTKRRKAEIDAVIVF
jgi:hypothetical protein